MKSLYDLLEISPVASDDVMKAAYRVLCNRYHPDKNIGIESATNAMSAINRAYAILSDPNLRKAYDESLAARDGKIPAARAEINTSEVPRERNRDTVTIRKTPRFASERSHSNLALYLVVVTAVLFVVVMIFEMAPSGPAGEISLLAFKEPPDPYLLRLNRGEALLTGNGSSQNYVQARTEFEAVANAKDLFDAKGYRARAAQRLGEIYLNGSGVPRDTVKAEEWFRKAAEYARVVGPAPALAVAQFFENGTNGEPDFVEAYRWYNLAAGTPFDVDKTTISRDTYDQMITLAKKKREALGALLSMEQINRAQMYPLPPCRSFEC